MSIRKSWWVTKRKKTNKKIQVYGVPGNSSQDRKEIKRLKEEKSKDQGKFQKEVRQNKQVYQNFKSKERRKRIDDYYKYGIGAKHGRSLSPDQKRMLASLKELEIKDPEAFEKKVTRIKEQHNRKKKHDNRKLKDLIKVMGIDPGEKKLTCVNFKEDLNNWQFQCYKHFRKPYLKELEKNNDAFLSLLTKEIIDTCLSNSIDTIVIGCDMKEYERIKEQREEDPSFISDDDEVNNFKKISLYDLYLKLENESKKVNINFLKTKESLTSQVDFVTGNYGERDKTFKYTSKKGETRECNPDINAAYNIVSKLYKTETNNLAKPIRLKLVNKKIKRKETFLDSQINKENLEIESAKENTALKDDKPEIENLNEGLRRETMEHKNQIDTIIKQMKDLELKNNELFKEIERLNIKVAGLEKRDSNITNNPSNTERIEKLERNVRRLLHRSMDWM